MKKNQQQGSLSLPDGYNLQNVNALDYTNTTMITTPQIGTTKTDVYTATTRCSVHIDGIGGSSSSATVRRTKVFINNVEQSKNGITSDYPGTWSVGDWILRKGDVVSMQRDGETNNTYNIYITPFVS